MQLKKLLFVLLFLFFYKANSQPSGWVADSLQHFETLLENDLKAGNEEAMIRNQVRIYKQAMITLDPEVYDYFYHLAADERMDAYPSALGTLHHYLGNLEFYRGRMEAAKNNFEAAFQGYSKADRKGDAAGMSMNLGIILERSGKYDSAVISYERAMPIFYEVYDTAAVAVCLENIAIAYTYTGEVKKALTYLAQTDSLLMKTTPQSSIRWTNLYYNYCDTYSLLSDFNMALSYALKGLRLSEDNKDERQINMGYLKLEKLFLRIDDEKNWMKYMRKTLVFASESRNELRVAEIDYSLASHYLDKMAFDSAKFHFDRGFAYFRENDVSEGKARGYLINGRLYFEQKKYDDAIREYKTAINLFNPSSNELSWAYQQIGASYLKLGNYDVADNYLSQALARNLSSGDRKLISETYHLLSDNNRYAGDYKKAYEFLVLHKSVEDSIFSENKSKQLA